MVCHIDSRRTLPGLPFGNDEKDFLSTLCSSSAGFTYLEFKDGGFGDADGVENCEMIDPSDIGISSSVSYPVGEQSSNDLSSDDGGGCFTSNICF